MNILDVEVDDIIKKHEGEDKFTMMFNLQKDLAAKYGNVPLDLDSKKGQKMVKDLVFCCVEEMFEMTNTLKNRAWTSTEVQVDRFHFMDELADSMAFFFEMLVMSGFTPEQLFELYLKKYKVNEFRQRSGY